MAEYLQAPPRRKALGLLADALTSGQEALNTVNLPYVGGLGGLLFGQAPQYLQDVSYGMPLLRGGNVATGGLGTLTPDTRMLDVATLPFVGAGAAKAGQVGAKTLGKEIARQVETGTGILGSNVLDPRQYATAFHGSPYKFDQFDASKIGSGEGAQMYGHGLYFAESPKVAKYYSNISPAGPEATPRRSLFGNEVEPMTPEYKASQLVDEMGVNKAKKFASDWAKNPTPDRVDFANQVNALMSGISKKSDVKNLGTSNLYKVDIPDEQVASMLDWDKPLGQQAKNVQDAINKTKKNLTEEDVMMLGGDANLLYGKDVTPNQFLNTWEVIRGQKNIGESLLNQSGVKGVKYFDNQSREGLKGTRNFVVFDPTDIKILERNNKGLLK
jgi:hypothetical protein